MDASQIGFHLQLFRAAGLLGQVVFAQFLFCDDPIIRLFPLDASSDCSNLVLQLNVRGFQRIQGNCPIRAFDPDGLRRLNLCQMDRTVSGRNPDLWRGATG